MDNGRIETFLTTDRTAIARLVHTLNNLKRVSDNPFCPLVTRQAGMTLYPRRGRSIAINVLSGCGVKHGQRFWVWCPIGTADSLPARPV